MKAFVTGATGNLGKLLIEQLIQLGWSVDALVPPEEDASFLVKKGITIFKGDITDRLTVDRAIGKAIPDILFHLAAYVQIGSVEDSTIKAYMYDVNVNGTRNVLKSALQQNVNKVVYLSSVAIYSPLKGDVIINEDISPHGGHMTEYNKTKYLAYEEALSIQEQGLALLVFMPGIIFGPGFLWTVSLLESLHKGKRMYLPNGCDKIKIPMVFSRDLVRAIFAGIEKNRFGEQYIMVGSSVTLQEINTLLSEITGKEINWKFISYRKAFLAAYLFGALSKFVGRTPRITSKRVKTLYSKFGQLKNWQQFDTSKARRELHWEPTPLKDAFKATADWFSQNYAEEESS